MMGNCICSGPVRWLHIDILANMARSLNSGTGQVGAGLPPLFYLLAVYLPNTLELCQKFDTQ